MKLHRLAVAAALAIALSPSAAVAQEPVHAVATFSILADIVGEIGGDRVVVTSLVGPEQDAHTFEPAPSHVRSVAEADILFVNGLSFEPWIDRVVDAAGFAGPTIVASSAVTPLEFAGKEDHDDHAPGDKHELDPHAWQSVANARLYATTIASGLEAVDPAGAAVYADNLAAYLGELDSLEAEIIAAIAALSEDARTVVTTHDAFGYFAEAYGVRFLAPLGVNTEAEATAGGLAALVEQIRTEHVGALFIETMTDPRLIEQIAAETGVTIGGNLHSDALSRPDGPAATYIDMMRSNVRTITAALAANG